MMGVVGHRALEGAPGSPRHCSIAGLTLTLHYPYPKMGDSTVHSGSVVGMASDRQQENHFSLTMHGDEIGGLRGKTALDKYPPSVMVDND